MSDLAAFMLARIAEDEAAARREANPPPPPDELGPTKRWVEYQARQAFVDNPARMLAECAAKRIVVELHGPVSASELGGQSDTLITCGSCGPHEDVDFRIEWYEMEYPCPTLRALAQPYADHPDFAEEWRDERP